MIAFTSNRQALIPLAVDVTMYVLAKNTWMLGILVKLLKKAVWIAMDAIAHQNATLNVKHIWMPITLASSLKTWDLTARHVIVHQNALTPANSTWNIIAARICQKWDSTAKGALAAHAPNVVHTWETIAALIWKVIMVWTAQTAPAIFKKLYMMEFEFSGVTKKLNLLTVSCSRTRCCDAPL